MLKFSCTVFFQILFKKAIYATQKTQYISITKKNNLFLFRNVRFCFFENYMEKNENEPCGQKTENY